VLLLAGLLAASPALAQTAAKDQTQLPQSDEQSAQPQPQPPAAGEQPTPPAADEPDAQAPAESGEDLTQPPPPESDGQTDTEDSSPDDLSFGEIPDVTVIELTDDIARRSIDALALVRDKYKDANLENYESWQDFVDKTDDGKKFEADIKAVGFANVDEW